MGTSPLVGTDRSPTTPAGRDHTTLGPSDSSDSGSDVAGAASAGTGDPGLPVDKVLGDDAALPLPVSPEGDSDSGGAGERRSAAGDGGARDGADIGADHVVDASGGESPLDEDEDPDLAFVDDLEDAATEPGRPNPEPDPPEEGEEPEPPLEDERDRDRREPGRG